MIPSFIEKSKIPHKPGIYIYKNEQGRVLYVGKAIDLYNRVSSYFNSSHESLKTTTLVSEIRQLQTIIVESEIQALILEANLIKKYLPPFNVNLKDDKDYLYIVLTDEDFPKVITARKNDLKNSKYYFGPFPSSKTVRETLKRLRKVFPWCSNPIGTTNKNGRSCFYYHLKLCPGACIGEISKEDYRHIIRQFIKFMEGGQQELVESLTLEMENFSRLQQFEKAQQLKITILGINYLIQPTKISHFLENPNFIEDQNTKALEELKETLGLPEIPERIEAYDISNISGTNATGSMVVLTHNEIDKSEYRRFKINISGKPNDYAMHAEMMNRRLKHPEWPYPQLFLIDGGRGQVRAVQQSIKGYVLSLACRQTGIEGKDNDLAKKLDSIPIFGLAKREEWLYPPEGEIIKLPKRSLALRALQKIRDESHRFAITYHRKLRTKSWNLS